jgi:hypothetical protein
MTGNRHRKLLFIAVAIPALFVACAAHEKAGDRAAAVGDWRTAHKEYHQALLKEPGAPALREKYDRARKEAVGGAYRRAQFCATSGDWACAISEADYALSIEDGNTEIITFKMEAVKSLGLSLLKDARAAASRGQFKAAFEQLKRGSAVSTDSAVADEAARAQAEIVAAADAEADRLRQGKLLRDAVELLTLMASIDGSKAVKLEVVRREYEEFLAAEYELHAQQGDAALRERRWADAEHHYLAALAVRPAGRAESLAKYVGAVARGEVAINRRDFVAAASAFKEAVASGLDTSKYAAEQLRAVEIRPYSIRIRSLLVKPIRPDGQPWVGPPSPFLGNLVKAAATYVAPGVGTVMASAVVDAVESIPPENRPTLHIEASLPDGRKLMTPSKKSLYVVYESEIVLASNHFDDRKLAFKVVGAGDNVDDVGVIEVSLKELIQKQQVTLADQSILALQLMADSTEGKVDGMFSAMTPVSDRSNHASGFSLPTAKSIGYRLVRVQAGANLPDYQDEMGMDGGPDLSVNLAQQGRSIYVSPIQQDSHHATWTPTLTYVFVEPNEKLVASVWDMDISDHDRVLTIEIPASALAAGRVEFATHAGSYVRLFFEPRKDSFQQLMTTSR